MKEQSESDSLGHATARDSRGRWLPGTAPNPGGRPKGWLASLKEFAAPEIRGVVQTLVDVAQGRPVIPRLRDGREGQPIIPTAADIIRAGTELMHQMGGRPVSQLEVVQAEAASEELAAVQAMSEDDIHRELEARGVFLKRVDQFDKLFLSEGEDDE